MKALELGSIQTSVVDAPCLLAWPDTLVTNWRNAPHALGRGFDAVLWRVKADSPLAVSFPRCLSKSRHSRLLVAHAVGSTSA